MLHEEKSAFLYYTTIINIGPSFSNFKNKLKCLSVINFSYLQYFLLNV